ncbi:hypothetical protein CHS0354_040762 [Potamilus streckersoni]|uniref:B box-type domain-containing protein n=1 Tax=Potamilus streckersoni TaxID=2493646 RepID=A0AAE0VYU6_9BIVA|nr:hypothetical protein CHS0354_040762 [Potamilus streckersoni]
MLELTLFLTETKLKESINIQSDTYCPRGITLDTSAAGFQDNPFLDCIIANQDKRNMNCEMSYVNQKDRPQTPIVCNESCVTMSHQCACMQKLDKESPSNHPLEDLSSEAKLSQMYALDGSTLSLCSKHRREKLEFYCQDHEELCCVDCVTEHHKECVSRHVEIDTAAEAAMKNENTVKEKLNRCLSHMKMVTSVVKSGEKELNHQIKCVPNAMQKLRKRVNDLFDSLEEKLTKETLKFHNAQKDILEADDARYSLIIKNLESLVELLNKTVSIGTKTESFILIKKLEEQLKVFEATIKKEQELATTVNVSIDTAKMFDISFEQSPLRSVHVKTYNLTLPEFPLDKPLKDCTAELITLIETSLPEDSGVPLYSNGVLLPNSNVVLVDENNNRCLLFGVSGQLLDSYQFPVSPCEATLIGDNEIAVTVPDESSVFCFCLAENKFNITKQIRCPRGCRCISSVEGGEIAVTYPTYQTERGISFISLNGEEIRNIEMDATGKHLGMINEFVVDSTRNRFIYSSVGENTVYCLSLEGEPMFTYSPEGNGRVGSIDIDAEGNLYVCMYISDDIHQLSVQGELIKVMHISSVGAAYSMCFAKNGNVFLLTNDCDKRVEFFKLA